MVKVISCKLLRYSALCIRHVIHVHLLKIQIYCSKANCTLSLSLMLLPLFEHRPPVKRFISLQFLTLGQSVGLLGREISPSQGRYLHKHRINVDKHPCLEWDSNPRSQWSSGRGRFMRRGHCDRLIALQSQKLCLLVFF
jgi:hypothetical protein